MSRAWCWETAVQGSTGKTCARGCSCVLCLPEALHASGATSTRGRTEPSFRTQQTRHLESRSQPQAAAPGQCMWAELTRQGRGLKRSAIAPARAVAQSRSQGQSRDDVPCGESAPAPEGGSRNHTRPSSAGPRMMPISSLSCPKPSIKWSLPITLRRKDFMGPALQGVNRP